MKSNYDGIVIFIPGFMGSVLRKRGMGECVNEDVEYIWSYDFGVNKDIFANRPELLMDYEADAVDVIRKITLTRKYDKSHKFIDGFKRKFFDILEDNKNEELIIYSDLIDFCVNEKNGLGLEEGRNFFLFPYDWRICNIKIADLLAKYIYSLDATKNKDIKIITHSMGGIVGRILLAKYSDIASRVSAFVQIACPTTGSAKAYYTLKERPVLHDIFDRLWMWEHMLDANRRVRLMRAISSFESIYQLLPPIEERILYDDDGVTYSALTEKAWLNEISKINLAKKVHRIIKKSKKVGVNIRSVYSKAKVTDREYKIDQYFNIMNSEINSAMGDGTVISGSAFAYTGDKDRLKIDVGDFDHNGICRSLRLFEELLNLF